MMIGPDGEIAAGTVGRGGMRTSRAEREQAIEVLKVAFVQDRLTKDEFDVRAGQALAARTYAELAALTADIPAGPTEAQPLRKPARTTARPPMNRRILGPVGMIPTAATVLGILLLAQPDNIEGFAAGLLAAVTVVVASAVTLVLMLKSRHQRHSGRQRTAEAIRNDLDGPHLILLVLTIAVLFVTVVTAMKK
jgi:Domain of unknown function (DUF1707)